jgi:hypothetical protein
MVFYTFHAVWIYCLITGLVVVGKGDEHLNAAIAAVSTSMVKTIQPRSTKQQCGLGLLPQVWQKGSDNAPNAGGLQANPDCGPATDLFYTNTATTTSTKALTFFLIYYNNVDYLAQQVHSWRHFSHKAQIQFLIVDDGSAAEHSAAHFLQQQQQELADLDIVVYEIDQDLAWNIGGARNLGFHVATTEWVLLSDADIVVPPTTMEYILQQLLLNNINNKNVIYRSFQRLRADHVTLKPHPAVMVLTKSSYWRSGGCDEDFVGNYGWTDVHFFARAERTTNIQIQHVHKDMRTKKIPPLQELPDHVTCPPQMTCLEPYAGTKLAKDYKHNMKMSQKKERGRLPWARDYLRFTWKRVW